MKIQTLTKNLDFENIVFNSVNGGNNKSVYSNKCQISILVLYNPHTKPFIILSADLIWFSEELVSALKTKAIRLYNTISHNIVFCASHTHGSPNPNKDILYSETTKMITIHIEKSITNLLEENIHNKKIPIDINSLNIKAPDIAINRRKKAIQFKGLPLKIMQSLPNYKKSVDENLNLIEFRNVLTKNIECIIIKHTCHPVADPSGIIGADYPGYLKEKLNNTICKNTIFLQGFCGDIRPKVIKRNNTFKDIVIKTLIGDRFRKTKDGDALFIADTLKVSIEKNINIKCKKPIKGPMIAYSNKIKIEMNNKLMTPRDIEYTIWIWGKTCFIFINAEVLSGYIFKNIYGLNIINVGYTNGMFGYLPTKKDILDGGYEVDKSRIPFGIKDRIKINTEEKIKKEILNQIKILIA